MESKDLSKFRESLTPEQQKEFEDLKAELTPKVMAHPDFDSFTDMMYEAIVKAKEVSEAPILSNEEVKEHYEGMKPEEYAEEREMLLRESPESDENDGARPEVPPETEEK